MSAPLAILSYHRVLPESSRLGDGRPYFERGTAVSESNFAAHVKALIRNFTAVNESEVLDWVSGRGAFSGPTCWLTFDDGYRDLRRMVAPILESYRLAGTAFVTTAVVDQPGRWLPADRWYATLTRATRRQGILATPRGEAIEFDLDRDYGRFVDGPERRTFLRASRGEQERIYQSLASALGVPSLPPADLYMEWPDIEYLGSRGWSFGGHGTTHAILPSTPPPESTEEILSCRQALRAHGLRARTFAYPDGAHDGRVAAEVAEAGWNGAVVLENRCAALADGAFALPRFIPADDPDWVDRVLLKALPATGVTP